MICLIQITGLAHTGIHVVHLFLHHKAIGVFFDLDVMRTVIEQLHATCKTTQVSNRTQQGAFVALAYHSHTNTALQT